MSMSKSGTSVTINQTFSLTNLSLVIELVKY